MFQVFKKVLCILLLSSLHVSVSGVVGGTAQIPYLMRLITESVERYAQLQEMIRQGHLRDEFERRLHRGIDNALGVVLAEVIEDAGFLDELKTTEEILRALEKLYGVISKNELSPMFKLHDKSIAESVKMINRALEYAKRQEKNAQAVFAQAPTASPRGASRMSAVTNAQILHSLSQLIKLNGQMLKLQSEQFGLQNREGKESVMHFLTANEELGENFKTYKGGGRLPRF